ncbi:meiosis regulator and mRNA stability factor 1-like isoform X2 [Saccostrea echinata]|uniref:meiosis regulator and mRNA stability factor 1-like isoform X2 n=1 Tax=Saccostrea echinata TaxID=191078 RepID=UPI002A8105DB|nr:meiosis regulator and mRNA stability factor 1-like isoform X2 [Saccostrea echinata]
MSGNLPPIGVFWDIENCSIPRWKSALSVVQVIRESLFTDHREVEFMCVCDTSKESKDVIQELNFAQINVVHINATSKNAADDKIRQSLRRFADTHSPPATVVLISTDVNFAADLSDLRHRKKFDVVLIHSRKVSEALKICATKNIVYEELVKDIPKRQAEVVEDGGLELEVTGLPNNVSEKKIQNRLKKLSVNCGGRVVCVSKETAVLRFSCHNDAVKARIRMEGEDVYGNKIKVNFPQTSKSNSNTSNDSNELQSQKVPSPTSQTGSKNTKAKNNQRSKSEEKKSPKSEKETKNKSQPREMATTSTDKDVTSTTTRIQNVVDKFSKDNRGSRHVLMLQQQLYQEGQWQSEEHHTPPQPFYSHYNYYHGYQNRQNYSHHPPDYNNYHGYNVSNSFYHYGSQNNRSFTSYSSYRSLYEGNPQNFRRNQQNGYPNESSMHPVYDHRNRENYGNYESDRDFNDRNVYTFQPITSPSPCPSSSSGSSVEIDQGDWDSLTGPVELMVSNLDYNISAKEWRKILFTTFHPHVRVLNVHVKTQPDNTSLGMVKVPSIEEARFAISQFHRKKIGYKRIHVTLKNEDTQRPASSTRMEAVALLSEAKGNVLPLFKFIELFDKRYHRTISVSELYKMRDTIEIREQGGAGRMVYLANSSPPLSTTPCSEPGDGDMTEILEQPVCLKHCPEGSVAYAEAVNRCMLPLVKIRLKTFAADVHTLLLSHEGNMPLMSFSACYGAEFSAISEVLEGGVPLEHLISCVPGIQIQVSSSGVKKIQWAENKPPSQITAEQSRTCTSPLLSQQFSQISREMVDLLKQSPQCRMPCSKFIPSYHHFFGRQCRVADYGYNRLKDLFEAIPHVVQVLGTGDRKMLTLSHKAQLRRFTSDLTKILKSQPGKQLYASAIPEAFSLAFNKRFDVAEYGMAYLDDLLSELPATSIVVSNEGKECTVTLPRKDQSPEEIERTKQFALEVVDLLKHNPQCRMPFNKFIPAYHHHFGRQCRVSDYGFSKLLDLFEAIPHVLEIEEEGEERLIYLTEPELRKILAEQIIGLLKAQKNECVALHHLMSAFTCHYGFNIPLHDFGVDCEEDLLNKLKHVVKVEMVNRCKYVMLTDRNTIPPLAKQVLQLLMDQSGGSLPLMELCSRYLSTHGTECNIKQIKEELLDYVQVTGDDESEVISLTALQIFARDTRILLHKHTQIAVSHFDTAFRENFGIEIKPALYGCPTIEALLQAIPHIVTFGGKGQRKFVQLADEFSGSMSPISGLVRLSPSADSDTQSSDSGVTDTHPEVEDIMKHSSGPAVDLLGAPVPSAIPSPDLRPVARQLDLMKFESVTDITEKIWSLSEEEKKGQKTPLCRTPTSELLQLAAQCLISRPPSTEPGSKEEKKSASQELLDLIKGSGWWKINGNEIDQFKKNLSEETKGADKSSPSVSADKPRREDAERNGKDLKYQSSPLQELAAKQILQALHLPPKNLGKGKLEHTCAASEEMSYDEMFRHDLPLETSSIKSDSSTLSDKSESPKKSPRKPRIAAKFTVPMDLGSQ